MEKNHEVVFLNVNIGVSILDEKKAGEWRAKGDNTWNKAKSENTKME